MLGREAAEVAEEGCLFAVRRQLRLLPRSAKGGVLKFEVVEELPVRVDRTRRSAPRVRTVPAGLGGVEHPQHLRRADRCSP